MGAMKTSSPKKTKIEASSNMGSPMDNDLHDLFLDELADALHSETQLTKALPKLIKAAESSELAAALEDHLVETQGHIDALQQVFESVGEKPRKKRCKGMEGIIEEGDEMVKEMKKSNAIDATIIAAGQKAEHYEIASYGTLIAWARQMGHDQAVSLLEEVLEQEKAADQKLTEIAESIANAKAEN
jgi:ferritin-like metal-binding protein YciE